MDWKTMKVLLSAHNSQQAILGKKRVEGHKSWEGKQDMPENDKKQ